MKTHFTNDEPCSDDEQKTFCEKIATILDGPELSVNQVLGP